MGKNKFRFKDDEQDKRTFEEDLRDYFDKHYPNHAKRHENKKTRLLLPIILIVLILALIICLYYVFICGISGGWILDSAEFYYDSEAEIEDELLNELYYNLDADSRMNVTNDTYFLVLSIPELDYTIRFDYLFEFIADNQTNLRIEQHSSVPKITSFRGDLVGPYNLSIEFKINSVDPDLLDVKIFAPDNIINGSLYIHSIDFSDSIYIKLDEGEIIRGKIHNGSLHDSLALPYNHVIIAKSEYNHRCPFR